VPVSGETDSYGVTDLSKFTTVWEENFKHGQVTVHILKFTASSKPFKRDTATAYRSVQLLGYNV